MIDEGTEAPDFELASDDGSAVRLSDLRGKPVVLYFYPKDDTRSRFNSSRPSSPATSAAP
jgi:peroxiredoxin